MRSWKTTGIVSALWSDEDRSICRPTAARYVGETSSFGKYQLKRRIGDSVRAYVDVTNLGPTDLEVRTDPFLEKAGVAVTPGLDFDPERGGRFLRLNIMQRNLVLKKMMPF